MLGSPNDAEGNRAKCPTSHLRPTKSHMTVILATQRHMRTACDGKKGLAVGVY